MPTYHFYSVLSHLLVPRPSHLHTFSPRGAPCSALRHWLFLTGRELCSYPSIFLENKVFHSNQNFLAQDRPFCTALTVTRNKALPDDHWQGSGLEPLPLLILYSIHPCPLSLCGLLHSLTFRDPRHTAALPHPDSGSPVVPAAPWTTSWLHQTHICYGVPQATN